MKKEVYAVYRTSFEIRGEFRNYSADEIAGKLALDDWGEPVLITENRDEAQKIYDEFVPSTRFERHVVGLLTGGAAKIATAEIDEDADITDLGEIESGEIMSDIKAAPFVID